MSDFLIIAVKGIPMGCVFGLLAVGLVLNYKTSGVFNLAFAAQAYAAAEVFYITRREYEWSLVPAAVLAILVAGPLMGVLLDRLLYRHLRTASALSKLVVSLGLLVALPEFVKLALGLEASQFRPPPLWPVQRTSDLVWPSRDGNFQLDAGQISTLLWTTILVIGLVLLFRYSSIGLKMRAVVESPRLVSLQGISAERVSMMSWMLSSAVAALAGVLVAPLLGNMSSLDFFLLLVAALAATVFAGLSSIAKALAGGIVLGVAQAELTNYLPTNNTFANGLRGALPFIMLFALLIGRLVTSAIKGTQASFVRELSDPLAGVDPPPPPPAESLRPPWMVRGSRFVSAGFGALILYLAWFQFDISWLGLLLSGVCLGVVMMSIVLVTGIGGTVSLCQASFAATGAFFTAQAISRWDMPVLLAMVLGGLLAAALGAIVAVPVIRLPAVYAGLATLAFALMFEQLIAKTETVSGGTTPPDVPRPSFFGIDFNDDKKFLLLAVAIALVVGLAIVMLQRGTTGKFLAAVRGSETAAASIGISPPRQRLIAFSAAAGVAGLGGGLIAIANKAVNFDANFVYFFGLVWLALVVSVGARSVGAAMFGGISFFMMPRLLEELFTYPGNYLTEHPSTSGLLRTIFEAVQPTWASSVAYVLFGLGALGYAKHPEGVLEFQTTRLVQGVLKLGSRFGRGTSGQPSFLLVEPDAPAGTTVAAGVESKDKAEIHG